MKSDYEYNELQLKVAHALLAGGKSAGAAFLESKHFIALQMDFDRERDEQAAEQRIAEGAARLAREHAALQEEREESKTIKPSWRLYLKSMDWLLVCGMWGSWMCGRGFEDFRSDHLYVAAGICGIAYLALVTVVSAKRSRKCST